MRKQYCLTVFVLVQGQSPITGARFSSYKMAIKFTRILKFNSRYQYRSKILLCPCEPVFTSSPIPNTCLTTN